MVRSQWVPRGSFLDLRGPAGCPATALDSRPFAGYWGADEGGIRCGGRNPPPANPPSPRTQRLVNKACSWRVGRGQWRRNERSSCEHSFKVRSHRGKAVGAAEGPFADCRPATQPNARSEGTGAAAPGEESPGHAPSTPTGRWRENVGNGEVELGTFHQFTTRRGEVKNTEVRSGFHASPGEI